MKAHSILCVAMLVAIAAAAGIPSNASAQASGPSSPAPNGNAAIAWTDGEVRAVDKAAGTLTLRHGAIPNIEMPPMTMVFVAADPAVLEGLRAGDKVQFTAAYVDGKLTATRIVRAGTAR